MKNNIVCVVPTIRPERMKEFEDGWRALFIKHKVTLVTVWDGDGPRVTIDRPGSEHHWEHIDDTWKAVVYRRTDAVRNLGFLLAARMKPTHVLTLDDDVMPGSRDPIADHLEVLDKRVCLDWFNTVDEGRSPYPKLMRGYPYSTRSASPVMLSHGVWYRVPDYDGETQLAVERKFGSLPTSLPYHVGPVPRGAYFPLCGMNVMVRAAALPYLYYAPMGPDCGRADLHRFADIFMGIRLKEKFDAMGWACYTGGAAVIHTRASDAARNAEQERLGREWLDLMARERWYQPSVTDRFPPELNEYLRSWEHKANTFQTLVRKASAETVL